MTNPVKNMNSTEKNKKSSEKKRKKHEYNGVLSVSKLIEAIKGTGGIVTQIAERAMCSRQAVYKYKDKYPEIAQAIADEEDTILDVCEEGLFSKIYAQDFEAIKYYLSKKGHKRGYIDRQDINHGGKVDINGKINFDVKYMTDEQLQEILGNIK